MPSNQQFQRMLQNLLIDRFHLKVHPSEKEFQVDALVVATQRTSLKPGDDTPDARHRAFLSPGTGGGRLLIEKNATMSDLVAFLMSQLPDRQIVDRTSLKGRFDFQLNFLPETNQVGSGAEALSQAPDAGAASYPPQALEEQLGLKLISAKAMIPVIIVDKAEMPYAN